MTNVIKGLTTATQIDKAIKQAVRCSASTRQHSLTGYKDLELRLRLHSNGLTATAQFRHRYTHSVTGKGPYMTIGQYPAITLEQARRAHNDNMWLLAQHINPITHRAKQHQVKANAANNSWLAYISSNEGSKLSDSKI